MAGGPGAAGGIRVDMHLHTRRSFDSLSDPDAVVRAATLRGVERVCVTDHNEVEAALELKARYPDRVIVGEEVKTAEGVEVIGLYLTERIPKGTPLREACERIRAQGGLVYVPHPFALNRNGAAPLLDRIEDLVDAVEGFNGRIHRQAQNRRAVAWARERGLPLGAGSDAHTLLEVGRSWVEVPRFDDAPQSFLAALRHGRIHGRASSRAVHLASTWAKLRKRLAPDR